MLSSTPFVIAALIVFFAVSFPAWRKTKLLLRRKIVIAIFFVYLLTLMSITIFPIPFQYRGGNIQGNNLIPFKTILGILSQRSFTNDLRNIGGNILLFVPFGILYPLVFPSRSRAAKVFLIGFLSTFLIESSQFLISAILGFTYRSFDVDDIILNALGVIVGYGCLRMSQIVFLHRERVRSSKRTWAVTAPILVLLLMLCYWGYAYARHSTPQKAQQAYDSNIMAIEEVPFAYGVVLITPTDPSVDKQPGYVAWYLQKTKLLGWKVTFRRVNPLSEHRLSHGITFRSLSVDGQTFVWGTAGNSGATSFVYQYNGTAYTGKVNSSGVWYTIVPLPQSEIAHSGWTITLPNKNRVPLFS